MVAVAAIRQREDALAALETTRNVLLKRPLSLLSNSAVRASFRLAGQVP